PQDQSKYGVEFCRDIVRLMDHLNIQKAHVIGYSMGSFITLKLVTMYPDRLLSAAPCGAGWERAGDPNDRREEIARAIEENGDFSPLFNAISPPGKAPGRRGIFSVNFLLHQTNDMKALACVMRSIADLVVTEQELRACAVPTLSVVGTVDPLRTGVDRMKDVMANHETMYVEGTDHISTIRDPKFLDALHAFLKNHSASAQAAPAQEVKPAA
ncbi:MAG: alpha/beta fold hydrolase, partial [Candidatus Hydrogenedentes bacterium]|nr:alpha/beta fold hydrolase [Candidatus Hydrogenedentota bacterium]